MSLENRVGFGSAERRTLWRRACGVGGGTGGQARGGCVAGGKSAGVEAARAGVCLWSGPSPSPGFLGPLYALGEQEGGPSVFLASPLQSLSFAEPAALCPLKPSCSSQSQPQLSGRFHGPAVSQSGAIHEPPASSRLGLGSLQFPGALSAANFFISHCLGSSS